MSELDVNKGTVHFENDNDPIVIKASRVMHQQLLALLPRKNDFVLKLPEEEDTYFSNFDPDKGHRVTFSLHKYKGRFPVELRDAWSSEILIEQALKLGRMTTSLVATYKTLDFNLSDRPTYTGGRRLHTIFSGLQNSPDIPVFETADELLEAAESLCPTTETGIRQEILRIPRPTVQTESDITEALPPGA